MRAPSLRPWTWMLALPLAGLTGACGGSDMECSPSTVEKDGKCVPRISGCAPGTVPDGSECVPACSSGERWDGTQCVPFTTCADGTKEQDGECVSVCESDEYWDGESCLPVPQCEPGTAFNEATGACEPTDQVCAPGSSWVGGECVPDLSCGPGTHAEKGACVPDTLPSPDVPESPDPDGSVEFTVPDEGDTVIVGGVIDEPEAVSHPDWDHFTFTAEAGTYLQIEAVSAGALRPAFLVMSHEANADGTPRFLRYALEGEGLQTRREVYLPWDGTYELQLTDHDHLLSTIFSGVGTLPVGGDEFGYVAEIQNLGAPTPTAIDSLPATETGDVADGSLSFFSFSGLSAGDIVGARSAGVPPPEDGSDVYAALMAVAGDGGFLHERVAYQTQDNAEVLVMAEGSGDPMVVQDHLVTIGTRQDFALDLFAVSETDCSGGGCETGSIDAQEHALLRWDLAAGDFLTVGAYMASGQQLLKASMLDGNLGSAADDSWVSPYDVGVGYLYASEPTSAYLWLREVDGAAVSEYTVDARVVATPELVDGEDYTDLPVNEMPPYTLRDAGIGHIEAQAGQVLFFSNFTTHPDGAWQAPQELLMSPGLEPLGPVIDTNAWNFPDGHVTPLFAYIKQGGHYLHYVFDGSSAFAGGTYDTQVTARGTLHLGEAVQGTPIFAEGHDLSKGLALYTFDAKEQQYVEISVTPKMVSDMVPDLWVFNFGRAEFEYVSYRWIGDTSSPRLGLIHRETATDSDAVSVGYQSPYEGKTMLLVQTASGGGTVGDRFDLRIEAPAPPGNDTCAQAGPLNLDANGEVSFEWNLATSTNTVTYSGCNPHASDGPDSFFTVDLNDGDTIEVEMAADGFSGALYLFTDCADVKGTCRAGSESGDPRRIVYTVPAGQGGTYILGADSHGHAGWFDMTVKVTSN